MKNVVCIYSGGMDSFTLLHETLDSGELYGAVSFNYGQRHVKELERATLVCQRLGIRHAIIDLGGLAPHLLGSALTTEEPVPMGHYAEESMKKTVVPFRNTVMLACAMAYAAGHKCDTVRYGAHAGDHTIYPDCREEYVSALNTVGLLGDWNHVRVQAPYQNLTKAGILLRGFAIDPHLDYGDTWTCYKGEAKACGTCGACQERLEAFSQIGRQDPLEYAQ